MFYVQFWAAQVNPGFIEHLTINQLQTEHRAYLTTLKTQADSLHYYEARYFLLYFNDSIFFEHYLKSKSLCQKDTLLMKNAGRQILLQSNKVMQEKWFSSQSSNNNTALGIYNIAARPNLYTREQVPEVLQKQFLSYKKVYNKKPLVAAALSALVPGMGKIYAGKTRSGLVNFFINTGYALQTAESYTKLGPRHPLTIFNAGMFAVFYLANIYGGHHSIIELRKERRKQFINDAAFYYN